MFIYLYNALGKNAPSARKKLISRVDLKKKSHFRTLVTFRHINFISFSVWRDEKTSSFMLLNLAERISDPEKYLIIIALNYQETFPFSYFISMLWIKN